MATRQAAFALDNRPAVPYCRHMQTTWNEAAAAEIRAEQARQRLSNRALAGICGLEQSNVARKVQATREITLTEFVALSLGLGVAPVEMLRRASLLVARAEAAAASPTSPTPPAAHSATALAGALEHVRQAAEEVA